jgi:hypothetical protein
MSLTSDLVTVGSKAARVPITAVNTALDITNVALDTTKKTAEAVGNTTTGVVENVGQAATSATGIASNTLQTFETVSGRIQNSTEEMARRRAEIEKSKTAKQQGKTKEEIAQVEADTDIMLRQIEDEYNQKKLKMEKEQEMLLERLNTHYQLEGSAQNENQAKISECYYYGFKTDSPPYEAGNNKTSIYYSYDKVWYYSFVPVSFVADNGDFIVFQFPKRQLGEEREDTLKAIDKKTGQKVKLSFNLFQNNGYFYNSQERKPVVIFEDSNKEEGGKVYFKKVWFFEKKDKVVAGGKRRFKSRRNKKRKTLRKKRSSKKRRSTKKYFKKKY